MDLDSLTALPHGFQVQALDPARNQRDARAERDRHDAHEQVVEKARVVKLTDQVPATHDPDIARSGDGAHRAVDGADGAAVRCGTGFPAGGVA